MNKQDRRKFLFAGGISLAGIWAAFQFRKQPEKKKMVRFLTQEGKLVEIDADKLPSAKRVASKLDIQHWIKK